MTTPLWLSGSLRPFCIVLICILQFSRSVAPNFLRTHRLPNARLPCPSPTPRVYSTSCPLNRWCHPTISSSVVPLSSHLQSFPESGSFQMSQFFPSGGQSTGISASASVLSMNIQDWFPSGWTGWISLQSKGLSRVLSNTTVQKHQFFRAQLSCHLLIFSSASVRSLFFLFFIVPILTWNVPLIAPIFLKRSLVSPILLFCFPLLLFNVHLGRAF